MRWSGLATLNFIRMRDSFSVLLLHNILYVVHTSDITYSYARVRIRMTQPPPYHLPPPGSQPRTSVLLENSYCCQCITFPLCSHFHLMSFLPSCDTSSCSSSTERSPHETECPYYHCRLSDFPSKFAEWFIFCLMDTVLTEMLAVCFSGGGAIYPCHVVTRTDKGKIVKRSYRNSYTGLWMTQTTASMPFNLFLLCGVCRIS